MGTKLKIATRIIRISHKSEKTRKKKEKNSKIEKKMFGPKMPKIGSHAFLIVLMLSFFNYAFFNCSYVYSLIYGMVHSKDKCMVLQCFL